MSNLSEKANYLKGLADGLQLNAEKSSNRVLLEVLDLLADLAEEVEDLRADHEELADFVDAVDEDLSLLEEDVADLNERPCPRHKPCHRGDFDEDEGGDDDFVYGGEDDEDEVTYNCPHCGEEVHLDIEGFDFDEDMPCPHCGKPLFPEGDEEDDAPADEEADDEAEDDDLPGEEEE